MASEHRIDHTIQYGKMIKASFRFTTPNNGKVMVTGAPGVLRNQ
jgi:hypothetical protein